MDYVAMIPQEAMKNAFRLAWILIVMALATRLPGQPVAASVPAMRSLDAPTNNLLVLSNATGKVRELDSNGLVLEANHAFLPRIKLSDLSETDLKALLETKKAYATLATFESLYGTNGQGAVLEIQLRHIWQQGKSLAEKIQTRLEILEDLREYNINVALLPGSMAAAGQYEANASELSERVTNREDAVEFTEEERAVGLPDSRHEEHHAVERLERANDRAMTANGQAVAADQQVEGYLAKCAAISARLATHGINVPAAAPFCLVPPLTMKVEVDAERAAN
jgi:hypothetical protein